MICLGRLAVWAGPALTATLVSRVFRGEPDAPLLVLLALVAPLAALVRPGERLPLGPVSAGLALPGLALVLCANLLFVADLLHAYGASLPIAVVLGMLTLLVPVVVVSGRLASWLAAAGIVGIVIPVLAVAHTTATAPWTAWARAASRPATVFSEGSPAVASGRTIATTGALIFSEPHRVTAVASMAVRVVERDGDQRRVHERQLASGDSVVLRPGDALLVQEGARLRFEQGKRIPGAAVSGPAWADPHGRQRPQAVLGTVGLAVTVVGAALALVGPVPVRHRGRSPDGARGVGSDGAGGGGAVLATALLAALVLAAASLGVYAMDAAPELLIGATPLTALLEAPGTLAPSYGEIQGLLVGSALLALLAGMSLALANRVAEVVAAAASPRAAGVPLVWTALVVVAATGTLWSDDAWTVWLLGLGVLAVSWAAPALGARDERGAVAGAVVGLGVFAGVVWLSPATSPWAAAVATPALVAAPLACLAAWLASRETRSPRRVAAPARR